MLAKQTTTRASSGKPNVNLGPNTRLAQDSVESDKNYDLISVLYHALKAAQVHQQFAEDAEDSGDGELVEFFHAIHEGDLTRAERARSLLCKRLTENSDKEG